MNVCKTTTALLAATIALTGCALQEGVKESESFFRKVFDRDTYSMYRQDIQQGNAISPTLLRRLQIGMSREQVHYLLGSPVTHNVFHKNRWDYYYYLISGTGEKEYNRVTLFFENDRLFRYRTTGKLPAPRKKPAEKNSVREASK